MIWIREDVEPTPTVDTVIFDVDGVLIDDTVSYYAAIKATVRYVAGNACGPTNESCPIDEADILAFKAVGGFNDDWILAYTLCGLILSGSGSDRESRRLIAAESAGRGMSWIRERYFADLRLDLDQVTRIAVEHYWGGDLLRERMGIIPRHYEGRGFVRDERALVDAGFFDRLRSAGATQFGVITGRSPIELQSGMETLGFTNLNPFAYVMDADGIRKPDPTALTRGVQALHSLGRALYVGDTGDDLALVLNYRRLPSTPVPCLAAMVAKQGHRQLFISAGADLVLDSVTELPVALLQLMAQTSQRGRPSENSLGH